MTKRIYFKDYISIQRADVERFGKIALPADVNKIYLAKSADSTPDKIEYRLYLKKGEAVLPTGKISATKRYLSPHCQKKDGSIEQVFGQFWDRRVEIFQAPEGQPRYGEYGLTKAMVYAFMKEMANHQIERVSVCISGRNIPSLKLSDSLVGSDERMEIVNAQVSPTTEKKWVRTNTYLQILNVCEAIAKMEKRFPPKALIAQHLSNQKGRA